MLITIIFVFVSAFTVLVFMAVYGKKQTYSEGMLLGVHIPSYAVGEPEVEKLVERHAKRSRRFYAGNLLVSIAISFLGFGYMSVFIMLWCLWLLGFSAGAMYVLYDSHKKLYDIKMKHGWHGASGSKIVVVDTCVSAAGGKLPFAIWWHLPVLAGGVVCLLVLGKRNLTAEFSEMWIFAAVFAGMFLLLVCLHAGTNRTKNRVYSTNTVINLQVNQLEKRVYSVIWLAADYCNLAAAFLLVYSYMRERWISSWGMLCYILIQTLAGGAVLIGVFYLRYKRKEILDKDSSPMYVDDDIYWKNGWYNNPNDKRLLIQDRFCSANYTMNMGRPAGKVITIGSIGMVLVLLGWMCGVFLKIDLTPVDLKIRGNRVAVSAPISAIEFESSDIMNIKLLKELPEDSFNRTNGLDDNKQLIGKFKGKETGVCRLYIYKGYSPVLEVELPEYTVFINSKEAGQTEKWYRELAK